MKKPFPWRILLVLLIIITPIIYLSFIYPTLPDTIPTHFDIDGKANAFGNKATMWMITLLLAGLSTLVYLLITNLPKIDPKKTAGQSTELYRKLALVQVVFMCALSIIICYSTQTGSFNISKLILPLTGLLFLILGNYMHSIKPNYFIGLRLPWTLENEDNWRKTHQLMGKLWVGGGFVATIFTLLAPAQIGFIVSISTVFIITIIPCVYSYRYFKKQQQSK